MLTISKKYKEEHPMKKSIPSFVVGLLCGMTLFGGSVAYAAGVMATPFAEMNQNLTLNGQAIELTGYNINGNNYFKLRDIGEAVGFSVEWNGVTRTVEIDTTKAYQPEAAVKVTAATPGAVTRNVPKVGDVIDCPDGTKYTITDVSRYDKNMFASGPVGELPAATCDWSSFPEVALPDEEIRHFKTAGGDYLFVRNRYESLRMQYTLQNLAGNHPDTSENGKLKYGSKGTPAVRICLSIPSEITAHSFWPWRASEIENLFNSCPPGTYYMEAFDVYKDGVFQRTEYSIRAI